MTRNVDESLQQDEQRVRRRDARVNMWAGTTCIAVGLLAPVLAVPLLLRCRIDCQAFVFIPVLAGFAALIGAVILHEEAGESSVGAPPNREWRALASRGW